MISQHSSKATAAVKQAHPITYPYPRRETPCRGLYLENLDKKALFRKLDGEAYWTTTDKDKAVKGGFLIGQIDYE